MDLLQALCDGPAQWRGLGHNHEGEEFTGRLELLPLVQERAVLLRFRALRLSDGRLVHEEATLLARDLQHRLCLWAVMRELPGTLCHPLVLPPGRQDTAPDTRGRWEACFASGPREDTTVFREEIHLRLDPGGRQLHYAHAWGLPGGTFADRSACAMQAMATVP